MASTLHQSTPSPYNNKYHHSYISELSALSNGSISPSWGVHESYPPVDDAKHGEDFIVPEACSDIFLFSDPPHGGPDLPALPECSLYFSGGGVDGRQGFNTVYQISAGDCTGEESNMVFHGFRSACSPAAYHITTSGDNWGIQSQKSHAGPGEPIRVGRYSVEERKDRILRYLKKRNQRNFNKTIKYACRKTLADRRARVRGRFAKNNDEVDELKLNNRSPTHGTISPCSYYDYVNHDIQIKQDGDEWLQETIASLMYNMPYIPQWQGGLALQYMYNSSPN